ncbi:unnamed protein product [Bursaphelenchus xylophilus]|uniref:(pine wood nematode) hypothetical protein n=1 Tax=Bursaphelenchus xylophilus TaxID=6326 RepID=A0A1I7RQX3_BURXY|nr:unnamed protein product [Bursaphelenchus xylophilus]CAG9130727.1 unnamed protein product [Bursaphelenchus xylophilus]
MTLELDKASDKAYSSPGSSNGSSKDFCEVCGAIPASMHFGTNACRPCAAFFRRSVVLKRKYKCKFGGTCPVNKNVRSVCAHCRYNKCLSAGMDTQSIRYPFDLIGPKKERISPSVNTKQTVSILNNITVGYKKFIEDTKVLYFACHPEDLFNDNIKFRQSTVLEHIHFERALLIYVLKMLNDYFHPYNSIPKQEQIRIFEVFQYQFVKLNQCYLNTKYFPEDDSKLFLHYGSYINKDEIDHFFSTDKDVQMSVKSFRPLHMKMYRIAQKYKLMKVDAVETAAMAGIVLWREANFLYPDKRYEDMMQQIYSDLAIYCKKKCDDQNQRYVSIVCLLRYFEEFAQVLSESTLMGSLMHDHYIFGLNKDIFK